MGTDSLGLYLTYLLAGTEELYAYITFNVTAFIRSNGAHTVCATLL